MGKLYTFVCFKSLDGSRENIEYGFIECIANNEYAELALALKPVVVYRDARWVRKNIDNITNLRLSYKGGICSIHKAIGSYPHTVCGSDGHSYDYEILLHRIINPEGKLIGCVTFDTAGEIYKIYSKNALTIRQYRFGQNDIINGKIDLSKSDFISPKNTRRHPEIVITEDKLSRIETKLRIYEHFTYNKLNFTYIKNTFGILGLHVNRADDNRYLIEIPDTVFGMPVIDIQTLLFRTKYLVITDKFFKNYGKYHENLVNDRYIKLVRIARSDLERNRLTMDITSNPEQQIIFIVED